MQGDFFKNSGTLSDPMNSNLNKIRNYFKFTPNFLQFRNFVSWNIRLQVKMYEIKLFFIIIIRVLFFVACSYDVVCQHLMVHLSRTNSTLRQVLCDNTEFRDLSTTLYKLYYLLNNHHYFKASKQTDKKYKQFITHSFEQAVTKIIIYSFFIT